MRPRRSTSEIFRPYPSILLRAHSIPSGVTASPYVYVCRSRNMGVRVRSQHCFGDGYHPIATSLQTTPHVHFATLSPHRHPIRHGTSTYPSLPHHHSFPSYAQAATRYGATRCIQGPEPQLTSESVEYILRILQVKKIPFTSYDLASDEAAKKLWRRKVPQGKPSAQRLRPSQLISPL